MLISEAQKICPDLVLMNGEDLTRFRDVSKRLWAFLRAHSWNDKVERLGLDEVFLDVSDLVSYNVEILNRNALKESFFQLSRQDPEKGFNFDANAFFGRVYTSESSSEATALDSPLLTRLLLASHLAGYLRHKLEEDFGYTSTCGVSTNKLLAKLAGTENKPKNQTTLISLRDEDAQQFMDRYQIRKIPGIGFKISHLVEDHVLSRTTEAIPHDDEHSAKVTTRDVLAHPHMSPELLEKILGGPGSERGIGQKVWNLLHGVDNTEVKEASDVPTQISIEDTYVTKTINTPSELMRELRALSTSLVKRMRIDLLDEDPTAEQPGTQKWLAHPKTLRLSTRVKSKLGPAGQQTRESFNRSSRSQPLPNFVFSLKDGIEYTVERLVAEAVLPLFRRLHTERQSWNLALINICVTNMVLAGNEEGTGGGRDISVMFKTQDAKLREWTAYAKEEEDDDDKNGRLPTEQPTEDTSEESDMEMAAWGENEDEEQDSQKCSDCGHAIPGFALAAHKRFHALGD